MTTDPHILTTAAELNALFGDAAAPSLNKEIDYIHPLYRQMIEASPFVVLATSGRDGLDVSPRGDPAGFVAVEDERTLLLPERRGNNRVDSLRNLVEDPRISLLFLIPGVGETLRVNGTARISVEPTLLERFAVAGKPPRCVLVIQVERAYFQCARAMLRSGLWSPPDPEVKSRVPSAGRIHAALTGPSMDADTYDRAQPARMRDSLY